MRTPERTRPSRPASPQVRWLTAIAGLVVVACQRTPPKSEDSPEPVAVPTVSTASSSPSAVAEDASSSADASSADASVTAEAHPRALASPELPRGARPCDAAANGADAGDAASATCLAFPSIASAFGWILAHEPMVLAVGEAHAPKGTERLPSATKRFTEAMLPMLEGHASDLIVEAWAPDPRCKKEVDTVAATQAPVKEAQAATNTNEYVALGTRARELGIVPYLLRPSCDDFTALTNAGDDVIPASLALIERLTERDVLRSLSRQGVAAKTVVTYGGAMHNDLAPSEELRAYSFGPALSRATGGLYVELDLIVPEYVRDTDTWKKLAFYEPYAAQKAHGTLPRDVVLYRFGEASFTLVFPRGGSAGAAPAAH